MRLAGVLLASCLLWLAPKAFSLSYNANYYAVYEAPAAGGSTVIYLVPKLSILIVASDIDIPIAFMPDIPSMSAILASNGTLGAFTYTNPRYTADNMALPSKYSVGYKSVYDSEGTLREQEADTNRYGQAVLDAYTAMR